MERERGQPLLAADNLGNLHQMVVYDVCEVVGGQFVSPLPKNLIVQGRGVDLDMAADKVVHLHYPVAGHLEAHGPVRSLLQQARDLFGRKRQRVAQRRPRLVVVDERLAACLGRSSARRQFLRRIEGIVCPSLSDQLLGISAVDRPALRLPVRGMGVFLRSDGHYLAILVDTLVGNDAAPVEGFDYILLRSRNKSLGVGVFNP